MYETEEVSKWIMQPLVIHKGIQNVLVNHETLNTLMGRLMQMCELNGDREQREALKRSIKTITRDWLRDEYANAGSGMYGDLKEDAELHKLERLSEQESIDEFKKAQSVPTVS